MSGRSVPTTPVGKGGDEPGTPSAGDNWSEDPAEKVVQLTRQLKVARGQLDKKSDLCDKLAEDIHDLEKDLETRDTSAQEARQQLNAAGAELRAAAAARATDFAKQESEVRELEGRLKGQEARQEAKVGELEGAATKLREECKASVQRSEEREAVVTARTEEAARLRRCLTGEEAATAQKAEAHKKLEQVLHAAKEEWSRREAALEGAREAQLAAESASCAQRLKEEADKARRVELELGELRAEAEEASRLEAQVAARAEDSEAGLRKAEAKLAQGATASQAAEEKARVELQAQVRSREALSVALKSEAATLREKVAAARKSGEELRASKEECRRLEASASKQMAASEALQEKVGELTGEARQLRASLSTAEDAARQVAQLEARLVASEDSAEQGRSAAVEAARLEAGKEAERAAKKAALEEHSATAAVREQESEGRLKALQVELAASKRAASEAQGREAAALSRIERLEKTLREEREMQQEAMQLLEQHRVDGQEDQGERDQELEHLSSELEQKESDIMEIHFDMVNLRNRLSDQATTLEQSQEELEKGRALVEEKEEKLQHAMKRQQEVVAQMNEATGRLQAQVSQLSNDLDCSKKAYQSLDEHTRAVIDRLEAQTEQLIAEKELGGRRNRPLTAGEIEGSKTRGEKAPRATFGRSWDNGLGLVCQVSFQIACGVARGRWFSLDLSPLQDRLRAESEKEVAALRAELERHEEGAEALKRELEGKLLEGSEGSKQALEQLELVLRQQAPPSCTTLRAHARCAYTTNAVIRPHESLTNPPSGKGGEPLQVQEGVRQGRRVEGRRERAEALYAPRPLQESKTAACEAEAQDSLTQLQEQLAEEAGKLETLAKEDAALRGQLQQHTDAWRTHNGSSGNHGVLHSSSRVQHFCHRHRGQPDPLGSLSDERT